MEQAKVHWNDDRLDHFAAQVDMRFDKVDKRFDRLEARFDALQHSMIITLAGFLAAFAAVVVAAIF
jgi:hypothetical protein